MHKLSFINFFFLISNKDIYSRTLPYAEKKKKAERKIQIEQIKKREKRKGTKLNAKERAKEHRRESLEVIPQALDQSNREPLKEAKLH